MKRFLVLCAVALSLVVGGCADLKSAFDVATTPVTVTPAMVYQVDNVLKTATAGLVGYRRLCIRKVIDPVTRNCRKVIETIQPYTRAAKIAIVDLRVAIRDDDQVTAITAYTALKSLINTIQTERAGAK